MSSGLKLFLNLKSQLLCEAIRIYKKRVVHDFKIMVQMIDMLVGKINVIPMSRE